MKIFGESLAVITLLEDILINVTICIIPDASYYPLGKPLGSYILTVYSGESIDFMARDKLLGYYPLLNSIHIGFVCGI